MQYCREVTWVQYSAAACSGCCMLRILLQLEHNKLEIMGHISYYSQHFGISAPGVWSLRKCSSSLIVVRFFVRLALNRVCAHYIPISFNLKQRNWKGFQIYCNSSFKRYKRADVFTPEAHMYYYTTLIHIILSYDICRASEHNGKNFYPIKFLSHARNLQFFTKIFGI